MDEEKVRELTENYLEETKVDYEDFIDERIEEMKDELYKEMTPQIQEDEIFDTINEIEENVRARTSNGDGSEVNFFGQSWLFPDKRTYDKILEKRFKELK